MTLSPSQYLNFLLSHSFSISVSYSLSLSVSHPLTLSVSQCLDSSRVSVSQSVTQCLCGCFSHSVSESLTSPLLHTDEGMFFYRKTYYCSSNCEEKVPEKNYLFTCCCVLDVKVPIFLKLWGWWLCLTILIIRLWSTTDWPDWLPW